MPYGIKLPPFSKVKSLENTGNFAVSKYYKFPFNWFYCKKLKMALDLMSHNQYNILDFGAGCGILTPELKKRSPRVVSVQSLSECRPIWKFDTIVCASVLEFVNLGIYLPYLREMLSPEGELIVASPMKNKWTERYFKLIKNPSTRWSETEIFSAVNKYLKIEEYTEWMGLYFALKATLR